MPGAKLRSTCFHEKVKLPIFLLFHRDVENACIFNLICIKCAHFQKMRAFSGKCVPKLQKNKFSDIGLASSKGLFFERPNNETGVSPQLNPTLLPVRYQTLQHSNFKKNDH